MSLTLIGQKIGMAQVFDKNGKSVVCTVIQAKPNTVLQIKRRDGKDGYNSIQLGSIPSKMKNTSNPLKGKFAKINVEPCRTIRESRIEKTENLDNYQVGAIIKAATKLIDEKIAADADKGFLGFIDVEGTSKGKGYQGIMKLHNYAGMPASHGHSVCHRKGTSTGMRSTPGRCFKGGARASRMGGDRVTVENLKLIAIKEDAQGGELLLVKGAVPGAQNGVVYIRKSMKLTPVKE